MKKSYCKSTNSGSIRILFLSYENSHNEIFLKVIVELQKKVDLVYKIVNVKNLFYRPFSIKLYYKTEFFMFGQLIDQFKPDILILANDQGVSATFIRFCRLRGIPSLTIQDGILMNKKLRGFSALLSCRRYLLWRIISTITNVSFISKISIILGRQWCVPIWGTGGATAIAVTGDYYKQVLISRGINPDKIFVTGYPLLDSLHGLSKDSSLYLKKANAKGPLILLITQPLVEDGLWKSSYAEMTVHAVVKAVAYVKGQLIVKVHPRESLTTYRNLINKYPETKIIITKDDDLNRLLLFSDVVLTVCSTVGLWAIAHKKPLLLMNCFPLPFENILSNMAFSIKELDRLPSTLKEILFDEKKKTTLIAEQNISLHNHLYHIDGYSSERIANLILYVVKCDRRISKP